MQRLTSTQSSAQANLDTGNGFWVCEGLGLLTPHPAGAPDRLFQISRAPPVVCLSCPPCHPQIPGHSAPRYTPSQDEATSHEITDTKPPALPAPLQLAPSVWWPDPAWADTAKYAKGKKWRGLSPSDSKEFNDIMA